jgi:hypothetical protein
MSSGRPFPRRLLAAGEGLTRAWPWRAAREAGGIE